MLQEGERMGSPSASFGIAQMRPTYDFQSAALCPVDLIKFGK